MRRQGVSPVRPLKEYEDYDDVLNVLKENEGDYVWFIAESFKIGYNDDIVPVIGLKVEDVALSMIVLYCDEVGAGGHPVYGNGITNITSIESMPCAAEDVNKDDAIQYLREIVDGMASGDFYVDEMIVDRKAFYANGKITGIINV